MSLRFYFLLIGLLSFSAFEILAQKRLIIKLKTEYRAEIKDKNSDLSKAFGRIGISNPQRRFPFHSPLERKINAHGKPLVDLSLMYEASVPALISTDFTLKQFTRRPEVEYAEWEEPTDLPLHNPNDPNADSLAGSQRQVLRRIMAYQAWNISKGDTNTVIGVLDTGIPVEHEDLKSQIKINPNDPPNGIDDDLNGFIDDYRGWDFGSNDNNPTPDNTGTVPGHGTSVSSLAGAAANNAKGVAGIGYNCKILPLKIWNWNGNFSNFKGYDAIVYAADRGCKVINCSWGSPRNNRQFEQDIINYATYNKDVLIVAAGGNTQGFYNFLPANYDNVFGVSMTDTTDQIFWASSQNFKLDIAAPGVNIFGIQTNGNYGFVEGGSSMASPMVAGAAGLVRSKFPELTGIQAGELLRVNSDTIYSVPGNGGFRDRSGRGRLNILNALQKKNRISIRPIALQLRNKKGIASIAGDTVGIVVRFENYLDSLSGFEASAFSSSSNLQIFENTRSYGAIGTLKSITPVSPFLAVVNPNMTGPEEIYIRIDVKAGNLFYDRRWFIVYINRSMVDLVANDIRMTVVENGRMGYFDISNVIGSGILFKNTQVFGDGGLMIGTGPAKVSNAVYDTSANDNHFRPEGKIQFKDYPKITQHAVHYMNDSAAGTAAIGVAVKQSSYELTADSLRGSVFFNYQITNRNSNALDSISIAQYNDWELENNNANFCSWIDSLKVGYTRGKAFRNRFAAVQLLSQGEPQFYGIDALGNTNAGNINLFDGFSIAEKWKTMSSGIGRPNAGQAPNGNNVVQVVGVKLRNFLPGTTRKVSFAYVFADSLPQLIKRAKSNQNFWNQLNTSPSPDPIQFKVCHSDSFPIVITNPSGVQKFNVYKSQSDTNPIYSGTTFAAFSKKDTSFFISGLDSVFSGPKNKWDWLSFKRPSATFSYLPTLSGDSIPLDSSIVCFATDTSFIFKNGWTLNGVLQGDTGNQFQVQFDSVKTYEVCLKQMAALENCQNISCKTIRVFLPTSLKSIKNRFEFKVFPNPGNGDLQYIALINGLEFNLKDVLGKTVYRKKLIEKTGVLHLSALPKGIYTYTISENGGFKSNKLIIE